MPQEATRNRDEPDRRLPGSGSFGDSFDEAGHAPLNSQEAVDFVPLQRGPENGSPDADEVDPFQHDSLRAQEAFDAGTAADRAGDEERAVQEYIRASKIAETAREWYLAAVACQRVGDFLMTPPGPVDVERAFRMYRRAVAAYEQCGLFAEARELAYRQMCLKLQRSGELRLSGVHRVELFLYWASAGFGYRPLRVVATACVVILVYSLIYWASHGVVATRSPETLDFWHALYFSGVTFATVGYGDFIPAAQTRLFALTEGVVGGFLMGFFVAVLIKRLSNS